MAMAWHGGALSYNPLPWHGHPAVVRCCCSCLHYYYYTAEPPSPRGCPGLRQAMPLLLLLLLLPLPLVPVPLPLPANVTCVTAIANRYRYCRLLPLPPSGVCAPSERAHLVAQGGHPAHHLHVPSSGILATQGPEAHPGCRWPPGGDGAVTGAGQPHGLDGIRVTMTTYWAVSGFEGFYGFEGFEGCLWGVAQRKASNKCTGVRARRVSCRGSTVNKWL